jgi:serine phosphatase RsbU (regulator of sigma subunit)
MATDNTNTGTAAGDNQRASTIDIALVSSINKKINSGMKLAGLLSSIMEVAREILYSEGSSILLTDRITGDLIFNVVIGEKGEIIKGQRVPRGKGIAGIASETKKALIINDVQSDPNFFNGIDESTDFRTRNLIALPMVVRDDTVGVLEVVNSKRGEGFNSLDFEKAQYIADLAAIAITNRQLLDDLSNRVDELSSLYEIANSISYAEKNEKLLDVISDTLYRTMKIQRISIILYDKESETLRIASARGLSPSIKPGMSIDTERSISGIVFRNIDPLIVTDIESELPGNLPRSGGTYKTSSFLSTPIVYQNKALGVFNLSDRENGSAFDLNDLRVASSVAAQIAEAYQNFLNEKEKEIRRRLEQEIDIAAGIQKKILPVLPEKYAGHSLAAYNLPAKAVGGDFYDFMKFDDNKYAVVMADISGKGIPAALFMGSARNVVRAETRINSSPSAMLESANRLIYDDSEFGMFVTLFYGLIDAHNRIIRYGSAGHNNQLLIKKKTGEKIVLKAGGKPLGMFDDTKFEEKILMYDEGDLLLLFTDGVVECLGEDELDIEMGEWKLAEIALDNIETEPGEIISRIKKFTSANPMDEDFRDDFTIMIIKF